MMSHILIINAAKSFAHFAEAFTEQEQFLEGKGVDAVYFPFHKANQFIGLSLLPTFMCNDVMKQPEIESDVVRYRAHLARALP